MPESGQQLPVQVVFPRALVEQIQLPFWPFVTSHAPGGLLEGGVSLTTGFGFGPAAWASCIMDPSTVSGPGIGEGGWLDAHFAGPSRLTGARVEFLTLRLTAREPGKREATFRFGVGQGTQDLGFRAEVPILFTVK